MLKPNDVSTEQVWQRFRDRLRSFIRSRVGQNADVEDLLQEVFLRIHANIHTVRQHDRLESWVFQVTRNVLVDGYKSRRKQVDGISLELPDQVSNRDRENANDFAGQCLKNLIDQLSPSFRDALRWYELEELSQQQIADRLGISLSGTKSRIQRGRRQLKSIFDACCKLEMDRRGNVIEFTTVGRTLCG